MLIYRNVIDMRKHRTEAIDKKMSHITDMIGSLEADIHKKVDEAEGTAHLLDHDALEAYMKSVDCSTCPADGECSIQNVARERGIR